MDSNAFWLLIGAAIGVVGAVAGGFMQGWASSYFERKRAIAQERRRWLRTALQWAANGRQESLRNADLHRANLRGINLGATGPEKPHADLGYADLRGADLRYADLSYANLTGADLQHAQLEGANLYFADLSKAILRHANLRKADLSISRLAETDLRDTDLRNASLTGYALDSTDLRGADLRGTDMELVQFYSDARTKDALLVRPSLWDAAKYDSLTRWSIELPPPTEAIETWT